MPPTDDFLWDEDFTIDDWNESIYDGRTGTISRDRSECDITIIVPFEQWKAAARFCLGYSYVDESKNLRRLTPVWHPELTWLYADRISGLTFSSAAGKDPGSFINSLPIGIYTWAKITVSFSAPPYLILEDDEIDDETDRYVTWRPQPYGELVEMPSGAMKYVCPGVAGAPDGKPVSIGRIYTQLRKNRWQIRWHEVPLNLYEKDDGSQPGFSAIAKTLNSTTFFGRKPGTLLCESVEASEPRPSPIGSDDREALLLTSDVTMTLVEWDPERGDTTVDKYGWQLVPGVRKATSSGSAALAYYYATDDGTLTGKPQWQVYDFHKAFKHWSFA